jgi:Ala-tRNA(Pro) deacylase
MTKDPSMPAAQQPAQQPLTRASLLRHLDEQGYRTTTIDHPAVATVAESSAVDLGLPGAHTKNLFLKDENGRLLLLVAKSSTKVDLKRVSRALGMGRLSFGKPELMLETLGVTPGSVTAFAIFNDKTGRVRIVLDNALTEHESVNCHPLENVATTNIALNDLLSFIRGTGHEPAIMIVSAP